MLFDFYETRPGVQDGECGGNDCGGIKRMGYCVRAYKGIIVLLFIFQLDHDGSYFTHCSISLNPWIGINLMFYVQDGSV